MGAFEELGLTLSRRVEFMFGVVSINDPERASDIVSGLRQRVAGFDGDFVLYDPDDDEEGFLLVGDDTDNLRREAIEFFEAHADAMLAAREGK